MHSQIADIVALHRENPPKLLVETAWAYIQFAVNRSDRFKLMFSSALEKEKEYPDFVVASQENFQQLVEVVEICQEAEILKSGSTDLVAISLWGAVHGLVMLILEVRI